MTYTEIFRERLSAFVDQYSSATQAAKALGVSRTAVCSWLNGRTGVQYRSALRLAEVLNLSEEILDGIDDEHAMASIAHCHQPSRNERFNQALRNWR